MLRFTREGAAILFALVCLGGCDGERSPDAGTDDAGAGADAGVGPTTVSLPQLTPCRDGWTEQMGDDGIPRCEPWVGERPVCTGDTALFPGSPGCTPLGEACTADRFAATLPASGVLFVDAEAAPGGDGTRSAPFSTVAEAFAVAVEGSTVALSKGTFDGRLRVPAGVTVRGACVAETTITDTAFQMNGGTVMALGFGTRLENVRVTGVNPGVWIEGPGVGMDLEAVLVEEAVLSGISVFEATSRMRDVAVRDMRAFDGFGRGLLAEAGGVIELTRGSIERARESGVNALEAQITLRDVAVLDTAAEGMTGDALSAAFGGTVTGEGVVVEGTEALGAYAILAGSTIELTDAVIRDGADDGSQFVMGAVGRFERVRFEGNAGGGMLAQQAEAEAVDVVFIGGTRAVSVQDDARMRVERAFATGMERAAFRAGAAEGTRADAEFVDLTVRETNNAGVLFQEGSSGSLRGALVERARGASVVVRGVGTEVSLSDVTILDGRASDTNAGRGLEARVGADVEVDGLTVRGCEQLGVFVQEATATLDDLTVSGTRAPSGDTAGRGLEIQSSTVTGSLIRLEDNVGVGLFVGTGSTATLEDVEVRGTDASESQLGGSGLTVNGGASVTVRGVLLEGNTEVSLAAFGEGTVIQGEGVRSFRTRERPCADTFCAEFPGGIGVGSYLGASIELTNFAIEGHPLVGAQVGTAGDMRLQQGRIANNPIGVNVEVDGFDFARLMNQVEYINNERNVDALALPVPDALDPLESP